MNISLLLVNCYAEQRETKIISYIDAFQAAANHLGLTLNIQETTPDLDYSVEGYNAVILSGSHRMISAGDYPESLCRFIRQNTFPLLGICFGHQILAYTFGCRVIKDFCVHKGLETVHVIDADPIFTGMKQEFQMVESHEERLLVDNMLVSQFKISAENDWHGVEAIKHKILPFWGVQFHPERSHQNGNCLIKNFLQILKKIKNLSCVFFFFYLIIGKIAR